LADVLRRTELSGGGNGKKSPGSCLHARKTPFLVLDEQTPPRWTLKLRLIFFQHFSEHTRQKMAILFLTAIFNRSARSEIIVMEMAK